MVAREKLNQLKARFGAAIQRADLPADDRLYLYVDPASIAGVASGLFGELGARYIVGIGADDRSHSGNFLVAHNFAFDADHLLGSVLAHLPADRNLQKRMRGVGIADASLVRKWALLGPVARAAGVAIDSRRDHPYAAYDRVEFDVITAADGDVWSRVVVRALEVFQSIRIIRQCLDRLEPGPLEAGIAGELPIGRIGLSSVEAPRGESHHFIITGENNRPRRWRVRAPTFQNLQGIPAMIKDQQLADMTITLGSIDPCFSCTDRLETIDIRSGQQRVYAQEDLLKLVREQWK